jgi:ABC-2 type transport system permease protein
MTDSYHLMIRALRESIRQPAVELTNIFIPMFFFAVTVGAIGSVAQTAFGVDNFVGFQMPVAVLQAVAGTAAAAGLATTVDIERGYFDKLLLTSAPRVSLAFGRLAADGVRSMVLTAIVLVTGLVFGSGMASGVAGAVTIVLLGGAFGVAYSGIGLAIALRTGSPQAAQAGFLIFFPLLFLSPAFAPTEVFADWLKVLAALNPVTYILEGMRELVLDGWSWGSVGGALASIAGIGAFTLTLTILALQWRARGA